VRGGCLKEVASSLCLGWAGSPAGAEGDVDHGAVGIVDCERERAQHVCESAEKDAVVSGG
jgi:hypothetical protein